MLEDVKQGISLQDTCYKACKRLALSNGETMPQLKDFNVVTFNEREYYATEEDAKKAGKDFETTPKEYGRAIAYAVAINNTADEAEGRFVASTYDLSAEYVYFTPEDVLNFNLKAKDSEGMPYYATSGYVNNSVDATPAAMWWKLR